MHPDFLTFIFCKLSILIPFITTTECLFTLCAYAWLAEAIYTNSAHQRVIETVNTEKRPMLHISFNDVDGKACAFWCDRPEFEPTFSQTFFFSLLKSHIASERRLFS